MGDEVKPSSAQEFGTFETLLILLDTQMNIAMGTFDSCLVSKLRTCKLLLASFHVANNTFQPVGDVHW